MQENAPNISPNRVESRLNLLSPPGTRSARCSVGGGGEESVSSLVESWNSGEGPSNGHGVDKARRQVGRDSSGGSLSAGIAEGAGARQGALTSVTPLIVPYLLIMLPNLLHLHRWELGGDKMRL